MPARLGPDGSLVWTLPLQVSVRLGLPADRVAALLEGATVRRVIAVPGRLINFVVG